MTTSSCAVGPERQLWLAELARAPRVTLESALAAVCGGAPLPAFEWLRVPQTGLAMVRGRIGGTGDAFNIGESTVTRAVLRLKSDDGSGPVGIAYQLGRDKRRAELAALTDAMLQSPRWRDAVRLQLIEPLTKRREAAQRERAVSTASTRVDFYTMVRGE
ncbi:phosphonate C-P lyase system protein PhnG [Paraburkholderia sp. NMBU_R16]|uniref:phosphonate C-P lyase system protein PhnG n=1 Tax=Paraburkholderia sp. NMBU_R16 TaxID=2698676 RepID=UPI001566A646|nr:phosphonate C-P lyase system protein PhnG [Paraburkholderia sp. NMBU_R16]NRO95158.1 phosphonate C-P lyase system protein PhnG [Paraburkholderia sp. NMBU_R16]